ncbi:hypothetical protein SAMN05444487_101298 [Marininema mesophilum]|uniref:Ethanolamine utilization protein n=1 Tax=Marininema mesophilum TaxID=1048340 RepID=A0A1H2QTY3_9BACL|nr:hypothetical protein [Marininema mesophilum]SDW10330.1 hypothetical protein SAMN05444487_101298 [Marininema mesophilum]
MTRTWGYSGEVEQALLHILCHNQERLPSSAGSVVILLTPAGAAMAETPSLYGFLAQKGIVPEVWVQGEVSATLPWPIRQVDGHVETWLNEMKRRTQLLLLPTPSLSFLARLIELDDADPFCALVLHSLLKGKRVGIPKETVDLKPPHSAGFGGAGRGGGVLLQRNYRQRMADAAALGIDFLENKELVSWLETKGRGQRELVTEEQVRFFAEKENGHMIVVSKGAMITPLALDTAKELGIRIETR